MVGATVHIRTFAVPPLETSVRTNAGGVYAFAGDARAHAVFAEARGHASSLPETVQLTLGKVTEVPPLVLPRGVPLRGRVVDATGAGVGGALVRAFHRRMKIRRATTSADGRFEIADLMPETYPVVVTAKGFLKREVRIVLADGGRPAEILIERGGSLTGTVRLESGEVPLAAEVVARRAGATLGRARADERGAWRLDGLPSGSLDVIGRAEGYSVLRRAEVEADGVRSIDLVLGEGADLGGVVRDADGAALAQHRLHLRAFEKDFDRFVTTDAAGAFLLRFVVPGSYKVRVRGAGNGKRGRVLHEQQVVMTDADQVVDLVVPGASLRGRVERAGAKPVAGAALKLVVGGRVLAQTTSAADGAFHFAHVPAGPASVVVSAATGLDAGQRRVRVGATSLDLGVVALAPGGRVRGTLRVAGKALAGVVLRLALARGAVLREVRTDEQGRYDAGVLPAADYIVTLPPETFTRLRRAMKLVDDAPRWSITAPAGETSTQDLELR